MYLSKIIKTDEHTYVYDALNNKFALLQSEDDIYNESKYADFLSENDFRDIKEPCEFEIKYPYSEEELEKMVINYRHLFQSTKPFDCIFVIGILEHHIILKDGTITIAKLMWCFLLHCFSNFCIETSHFYVRMTKPFRYSRKWHSCLIQVHCPRSSEKM